VSNQILTITMNDPLTTNADSSSLAAAGAPMADKRAQRDSERRHPTGPASAK
jgi:hypothetical protein